ncbi:MAG: HTTM domain-containing protein [Aeromicrobium sp.]
MLNYFRDLYAAGAQWLFEDKRALRGTALARILAGTSVLGILTTNFRARDILFGQGSVWNKPLQDLSQFAPPHIPAQMGNTVFGLYYVFVMILALFFVLGWHTRVVGPLMLIGEVSIIARIPVLGDQGDNILRIGLFLLLFMQTNEFWSLDARRRARNTAVPQFVLPRWFSNAIHNIALGVLGFQLIIIYISAGMFKVQGALWQHGTAIYYPMQLQEFKPFPFLSDFMTHSGVMVGLATYVVVFTQLYFPLMLLRVTTRRIAIGLVILFHVSIAVLMALPWFSLTLIAFDAIWVSSSTYIAIEDWLRPRISRLAHASAQ